MRWICWGLCGLVAACTVDGLAPLATGGAPPLSRGPPAPGVCGTGSWRPGWLEIHHLDLGQADATLIVGPTGRTLLVDAGEARWDGDGGALTIGDYVRRVLGCARLDQVLITHFHVDHVGYPGLGGLWHLVAVQGFVVGRTIHRDLDRFRGERSGTLTRWRAYLAGEGRAALSPQLARVGAEQIDLGPGVSFRIVASDGDGTIVAGNFDDGGGEPPNENDYSIAALLRFGRLDYFIAGDLTGERALTSFGYGFHDVEVAVARRLPEVDVYRVSHHGSDHSSSPTLLAQIAPKVSIVSVGNGNGYGHPHAATVRRLIQGGPVYLTERGALALLPAGVKVAGNVVLKTADGLVYEVNGDRYLASDGRRVDADGDGYFLEADPDDRSASIGPAPRGGCDDIYQRCAP
jgi:beta-lactamase superfamily II metal-dependent hydrolase